MLPSASVRTKRHKKPPSMTAVEILLQLFYSADKCRKVFVGCLAKLVHGGFIPCAHALTDEDAADHELLQIPCFSTHKPTGNVFDVLLFVQLTYNNVMGYTEEA